MGCVAGTYTSPPLSLPCYSRLPQQDSGRAGKETLAALRRLADETTLLDPPRSEWLPLGPPAIVDQKQSLRSDDPSTLHLTGLSTAGELDAAINAILRRSEGCGIHRQWDSSDSDFFCRVVLHKKNSSEGQRGRAREPVPKAGNRRHGQAHLAGVRHSPRNPDA